MSIIIQVGNEEYVIDINNNHEILDEKTKINLIEIINKEYNKDYSIDNNIIFDNEFLSDGDIGTLVLSEKNEAITTLKYLKISKNIDPFGVTDPYILDLLIVSEYTNIDIKNIYKDSLLHNASKDNNLKMVKYLVEKRINLNIDNKVGLTAFHYAAICGHLEVVEYLVESGVDINAQNDNGNTSLHFASKHNYLKIIKYLVKNGSNININNKGGNTPLHDASRYGHLEIVKYLVEKGADININNVNDNTPLYYALSNNNSEVVEYIESI